MKKRNLISEAEFRKIVEESFLKDVPDKFVKGAKKYLGTEDAEAYIADGYYAYSHDPEDENRKKWRAGKTERQIAEGCANGPAYNLLMSYDRE